ncbi:MAG TPA: nuclear transport factor 2 family protein [Polyangiaceae bacterium]|nr:nuclear transport factor 2 family protein [Polyangiaceae bacterium]
MSKDFSSPLTRAELRAAIEDVVYTGCAHLDDQRFGAWLETTAPEFRYAIKAYSPDIRREMTWLDHDRKALAAMIDLLPKHHLDGAQWLRQAVVGPIVVDADDSVRAVSSLAIFHTVVDVGDAHLEGGSSRLFAVGRYYDRLHFAGGHWRLFERTAKLDTRQLGAGSHLIV